MFFLYVATFTMMSVLPNGLIEAFKTETDTGRDDLEIRTKEMQVPESDLTSSDSVVRSVTVHGFVDNEEREKII